MKRICFVPLVPVLLVYHFIACFSMTPTNLATDQAALFALKSHISPDSSNVLLHNWSTATSCCNWIGVTCGRRHYRVTALNLIDMGLTGTIPPHLGNLSFLALLNMRNNSFHGHLPDQLAFLRRLKVINLRVNNFDGQIPSWFGVMPKLQRLLLSNNSFSGSIRSSIFNMSSLQLLDLGFNSLSGSLPADMCNQLPKLELLTLHFNQLYGVIPSSTLHKCKRLQKLSMSFNKFSGSIPKEIANLTMLEELYLGTNNLEGEIPEEVGYLEHLEILSVPRNKLNGSIQPALFNISSLIQIDLQKNHMSGSLPSYMCYRLLALNILSLAENKIIGNIPRGIRNCTSLMTVYLRENLLTGAIPHEFSNLPNILFIELSFNGLSGSIPPIIFNISTVQLISLSGNNLEGQLPQSFGLGVPNLEKLILFGNKLSGIIPTSISNVSKLTFLELSDNSFTGFMPNSLGNLGLLEWLNVESNSLTTESSTQELRFLTSLTNCQNLRHLGITSNPWNGVLPISIGNFSASLEVFHAYDCNIKGHIPREIGNLSNLITLTIRGNELIGSIPPTLGRLQKLQGLSFAENKLEGSMPYDLCLLRSSLVYLYLSGNDLSGPIPSCIGNLTSLRELRLNSNKFMSTIPLALTSLTGILKLNLSSNYLSGNLPSDIVSLKAVAEIDISKNHLSGKIPSNVESLTNLVQLFLDHNGFEGPIPPSFGELASLELLDLSHNNLAGVIPMSLEKLKYLKVLNLSSNRLHGEIPSRGPFTNFSAELFMLNDALCGAPRFQVPPCKTGSPRRLTKAPILVLKYVLPAIVITVIVLIFLLIRCRKKNKRIPTQTELLPIAFRRVSYQEILQATNGFNQCNLLGNGSFGYVYRGILSDGVNVAIKVFNLQLEGAFKSFDVECEVLRNIRHRNLIKIISSCSNNLDFKALVLDYMPNESLEKWLYSHNYYLDILQRLNIMVDVALALEYLHHGYSTPIIHCDLKPSNILLDGDMVARVGDFGIAKLLGDGEVMKQTMTLATIGYMAPEYGTEGIVSTRGDVFSYGIVLMETFTRKKPTDETFTGEMSLKRWVRSSFNGSITEVVDSNLLEREVEHFAVKEQCVSSVLGLAVECTADSPEDRINMKDIVQGLTKIRGTLLAHLRQA